MKDNVVSSLLEDDIRANRRTFIRQAGLLLLATGGAGFGSLAAGSITHGASALASVSDVQSSSTVWSDWEDLGGILVSEPGVSSWAPGRLDVFVRGTDNALWHKWYNGSWSGWESLGGTLNSGPGAVPWDYNRIDVFVCGTNRHLYHKWWH